MCVCGGGGGGGGGNMGGKQAHTGCITIILQMS